MPRAAAGGPGKRESVAVLLLPSNADEVPRALMLDAYVVGHDLVVAALGDETDGADGNGKGS